MSQPINQDENEGHVEAAEASHVWGRGGEGPHALLEPEVESHAAEPVKSQPFAARSAPELAKSIFAEAAPVEPEESVEEKVEIIADQKPEGAADTALKTDSAAADNADADSNTETAEESPSTKTEPNVNDVAIGFALMPGLFFFVYAANYLFGGYCFESDKINALFAVFFFWSPAFAAACLLSGDGLLKVSGTVMAVVFSAVAIFAGQYFHIYNQFTADVGPYGPLVRAHDENGWHICEYESNWLGGDQVGSTTFTRERHVGPGLRYVRKMRLGEPP